MENPTNQDLLERIDTLEAKVDDLLNLVQKAAGAWTLLKVMGTIMIGLAAISAAFHNWWQR